MKFTYFRQRAPEALYTSPQSSSQDVGLKYLREQVLKTIYTVISILGSLAYLANLPTIIRNQSWNTLILYTATLSGVLIFTIIHKIPYIIKALYFLAILYLVGLSDLLADGLYGSGRIFFLILPILTGLLIGLRGRFVGITISVVTIAAIAALMLTGQIVSPEPGTSTNNNSLNAWVIAIASFTLIVSVTSVIMGAMLNGLDNSLKNQSRLTAELEVERNLLEQRVLRRTEEIERRLVQLRTAAEISRTISTILDIHQLLPKVCELVQERFDLYYVGIFLIKESQPVHEKLWEQVAKPSKFAVLAAGSGEAGRKMLSEGHHLEVGGESMIGWCTANKSARIALDVGHEAVRFNNPFLPETRSELALPIQAQNVVLGAMTIQSTKSSAFDQDDITILQGVADSLASAIENARLFAEVQASLEEIQHLHHQYLERSWSKLLEEKANLEFTFENRELSDSPQRRIQMPILLRDQSIGEITIEAESISDDDLHAWKPEELALIEAVTTQAGLALENARLLDEAHRRILQEEQLNKIMDKSQQSLNLETVMKVVVQELGKSIKSSRVAIQLENNPEFEYPEQSNHKKPSVTTIYPDSSKHNGSVKSWE